MILTEKEWAEQYKRNFEKCLSMEPWQRQNFMRLLEALGGEGADVIQTESEGDTLCWLAGWDDTTVTNMCSIFNQLRRSR